MSEIIEEETVEEVIESNEESTEQVAEPTESEISETPEYTPNFSYKVKDEEFNFDERIQGAVKSVEDEEYFRDLYTKSAGLDSYKEKYADVEGQMEALVSGYRNMEQLQQNKDVAGVTKLFRFSDDDVLDYAEKILSHRELPEEQRVQLEKQQSMEQELHQLRQQQTSTQENIQTQAVQRDLNELNGLITSEYKDVAKSMKDAGYDMAWEVGVRGHAQYKRDGVEPTIKSVVNDVANAFGHLNKPQQVPAQEAQTGQQTVRQVPVLPNLHGNTNSPIQAKVKSLADLHKLASMIPSADRR